ncbi:hypothetical protein BWK62_06995 [Flavobacterium oreochromis]|uniref:Uncharacterized protein n=1 Tax=Flavobacterium columnare TaxID=996 RepID=A0A2D0AHW5_9FLAO|nr:hypothetical protein BWK62_06995 [Flavobacterium oreochromis]
MQPRSNQRLDLPCTKSISNYLCKEELKKIFLRVELISITNGIISWVYSPEKDSNIIFPLINVGN